MMRIRVVAATVLLLASSGEARQVAATRVRWVAAADAVSCTIRAILGQQQPGGIDKRLAALRKQLTKPPFSAFKRLTLLSVKPLKIIQGATQRTTLPTGKIIRLTFKERLLVNKQLRLRMHLSITPPKAKSFLPGTLFTIADGGTLLVAGDAYRGGTLVVGMTCRGK